MVIDIEGNMVGNRLYLIRSIIHSHRQSRIGQQRNVIGSIANSHHLVVRYTEM